MISKTKIGRLKSLPGSFEELVQFMPPMAIRDDVHHRNSVEMIDHLMQIDRPTRGQTAYVETLVDLVGAYEAKRHAIEVDNLSGVRMLKYVLSESGTSASELGRVLGMHPTMGSKILNGSRHLTWSHAKVLAARFKVRPEIFMD